MESMEKQERQERLQRLREALLRELPALELREAEPLAKYTSFRIGGPAALLALPASEQQLREILQLARKNGVRPVILGAGTNVLVPDAGLETLLIRTKENLTGLQLTEGGRISAECGVTLAALANFAREQGLTGLEFAHGIPGTVGGGLMMNAGAYGGELAQVTARTVYMHPDGSVEIFEGARQGFGYRRSAFAQLDGIILRAEFALQPGDPAEIRRIMDDLAARRRASQPLEFPSAGSTFRRPAGGYAARLIDGAGLKGLQVGGAAVSEKHAGFVINRGGASCADVLALMAQIQMAVEACSGIRLEPEVRLLSLPPDG